ncbi:MULTISPECIES: hypothetical protein [Subtercola]|uniref:YtxH domain-containing protein n=1 Tax=Subtercola vilae TaxID=2056433 RepID=A0A4T2CEL1_9MICO|nr:MULTISPECIES: hypothetical protein [Subtercola]MEA9983984.1 hypothetical protein [Subtercola sp. RTI3]TIH40946.1 hypothetical protein D4765_00650 [Subtercola vilae]
MRSKVTLFFVVVIGFAAYTLGAKAGKARYKEIATTASTFWNDPKVQKARKQAVKTAKKATADASDAAEKAAKKAAKRAKKRFS